jgi:hypothetical protein
VIVEIYISDFGYFTQCLHTVPGYLGWVPDGVADMGAGERGTTYLTPSSSILGGKP